MFFKEDIQIANRFMNKHSLIIREMHIEPTVRYDLTPVKMAITLCNKSGQLCGKK